MSNLIFKPTMNTCALCGEPFTQAVRGQAYCGLSCRKKAERQRAKERDPKRAAIEHEKTAGAGYFGEVHNPTVEDLDKWALALCTVGPLNPAITPVKVTGAIPEWNGAKDVTLVIDLSKDFYILFYSAGASHVVVQPKRYNLAELMFARQRGAITEEEYKELEKECLSAPIV